MPPRTRRCTIATASPAAAIAEDTKALLKTSSEDDKQKRVAGVDDDSKKKRGSRSKKKEQWKPRELPPDFPERIGYACLNTILRVEKPPVFCSRTLRLSTLKEKGMEYVYELARQNLKDLEALIRWNDAHHIKFMRMSSEMFPFASHEEHGYSLVSFADELKQIGSLAKELGHRLTMHPGQFNQLGSPSPKVVDATRRDLIYHAEILDLMDLPSESIMILHMGGVYGDKEATIQRWEAEFQRLPKHVQDRLVIENDELNYNVEEILPTCKKLNIPLVFDYHHHDINPGTRPLEELLPEIAATWTRRGIRQKVHYSEGRQGAVTVVERRGHSDRVKSLPLCGKEVDLMIEAKDKEQAVLEMFQLYGCFPVDKKLIWKALPEATRVCDKVARKVTRTRVKKTTVKQEAEETAEENTMDTNDNAPGKSGDARKRKRVSKRVVTSSSVEELEEEGGNVVDEQGGDGKRQRKARNSKKEMKKVKLEATLKLAENERDTKQSKSLKRKTTKKVAMSAHQKEEEQTLADKENVQIGELKPLLPQRNAIVRRKTRTVDFVANVQEEEDVAPAGPKDSEVRHGTDKKRVTTKKTVVHVEQREVKVEVKRVNNVSKVEDGLGVGSAALPRRRSARVSS